MLVIEVPVRHTVDARGRERSDVLLKLVRAVGEVELGEVIAIWSTDVGVLIDIPDWVDEAGHRLVGIETRDGYDEILVQKLA